jgi:hypothetical protein
MQLYREMRLVEANLSRQGKLEFHFVLIIKIIMHINMTVASLRNDIVKAESSVLQLGGEG